MLGWFLGHHFCDRNGWTSWRACRRLGTLDYSLISPLATVFLTPAAWLPASGSDIPTARASLGRLLWGVSSDRELDGFKSGSITKLGLPG